MPEVISRFFALASRSQGRRNKRDDSPVIGATGGRLQRLAIWSVNGLFCNHKCISLLEIIWLAGSPPNREKQFGINQGQIFPRLAIMVDDYTTQ